MSVLQFLNSIFQIVTILANMSVLEQCASDIIQENGMSGHALWLIRVYGTTCLHACVNPMCRYINIHTFLCLYEHIHTQIHERACTSTHINTQNSVYNLAKDGMLICPHRLQF